VSTKSAEETAIRFDQVPAAARDASDASSLIRGVAIGLVLTATAALLGLLLTLVAFGYSVGELL
jgi:hypothetical protein